MKVLQGRLRAGRGVGIAMIQGVFDIRKIAKDDTSSVDTLFAGELGTVFLTDRFVTIPSLSLHISLH